MRFPPAVILNRFGFGFYGLKYTTNREEVTTLSFVIVLMVLGSIKNMETVPSVFVLVSPCARFPNYFPNAANKISLLDGSLINVLYFGIVCPVIGYTTSAT